MEISKSTPYVRYRENISSTLHKGTIHIESEYLDRERKTTIESIEGQTWQNMVNGENKEEDILPRLGLKIEGNEDVLDSVEQHMPIDTIIGDIEPVANEDGTYTYEISTMEGSYAKTLDGENNFSLTSDGLVGDMYIKYNAQGEEVNGNIVMDNWQSNYTIENSNTGEINSAILKGQTLINLVTQKSGSFNGTRFLRIPLSYTLKTNAKYFVKFNVRESSLTNGVTCRLRNNTNGGVVGGLNSDGIITVTDEGYNYIEFYISNEDDVTNGLDGIVDDIMVIEYQQGMENWDIPYFEGMQSVKMPVLTTRNNKWTNIPLSLIENNYTVINGWTAIKCSYPSVKVTARLNNFLLNETQFRIAMNNIPIDLTDFKEKTMTVSNVKWIGFSTSNGTIGQGRIGNLLEYLTTGTLQLKFEIENEKLYPAYDNSSKSNILTVNEPVELHGIGDVKDELDCLTGEVTERIGEIVLDGSQNMDADGRGVYIQVDDMKKVDDYRAIITCDKLPTLYQEWDLPNVENGISGYRDVENKYLGQNWLYIKVNNSIDVDEVRQMLIQNPITVQYELSTESIKTVDLSVKDQDDKIIQSLHTHPSTTHINLSSDGLIPSAELSYTMYGNIGETTGEQITDGTDSKLIEGKVYGDTLLNVLPSPSLKNSMDDISMQKLNNGYDNINVVDGEFISAILQGWGSSQSQALPTNIFNNWENKTGTYTPTHTQDGYFLFTGDNIDIKVNLDDIPTFKRNVEYTFIFRIKNSTYNGLNGNILKMEFGSTTLYTDDVKTGIWKTKMSFSTSATNCYVRAQAWPGSTGSAEISLQIIEGDYTNIDVPESSTQPEPVVMPSIKTTGKNLFDKTKIIFNKLIDYNTGIISDDTIANTTDFIKVLPNTQYTMSFNFTTNAWTRCFGLTEPKHDKYATDVNGVSDKCYFDSASKTITFTTSPTTNYLIFSFGKGVEESFQLEQGSTVTSYEPHKSNTLTTPEDVTLRAIGDVKDTLDLLTGQLTQRIDEDGSVLSQEIVRMVTLTIVDQDNQPQTVLHSFANGYINVTSQGSLPKVTYEVPTSNSYHLDMVKPNTQYTTKSSSDYNATIDGTTYPLSANGTFTTPSTITDNLMVLDTQVDDLMFIEGDVTGRELDYFTGLQSVDNIEVGVYPSDLDNINFMSMIEWENDDSYLYRLPVKGQRLWYKTGNMWNYISFYDKNKQFLGQETNSGMGGSYQLSDNLLNKDIISKAVYFRINKKSPSGNVKIMQLRTKNNLPDTPYTDNIISLTTNEPIALHKIGDVKDELDLVNECVVRKTKCMTFDGSDDEKWVVGGGTNPNGMTYFNYEYIDNNIVGNSIPVLCDKFNYINNGIHTREKECIGIASNSIRLVIKSDRLSSIDITAFRQWLSKNPITVIYELGTPTTEPVRIVPQNARQSTASLTLQSPLQKVGNVADQLRWNPYKGHYVRYNYIQDGVANSTYTFEDLKDMNERKFVNLYNQRTYIDTDHTVQVISHGLSRYCLAEQGKQYQVRWDWIEQPSVDTIKVDLCGNVKEILSSDNSVVIDVEKFTHQFIQIQGLGLTGKITNLMVIETVNGEIPDVDFFSGIQCVGNTVNIDGNTKVQIDMEQTNGNLIDIEPVIFDNGNCISYCWSENYKGMPIKNGKTYTFKHLKKQDGEWGDYSLRTFDENLKLIRTISLISGAKIREHSFTAQYNEKYIRGFGQMTSNGSTHTHYPVELCYTDMAKDGIRPRYYDKESIILPMKLCRVGNIYDNLYYDDLKGYYRIQQSIGHKYFTGETTEVWTMETTNGYRTIKFTCTSANIDQIAMGQTICNSFKHLSTINDDIEGFIIYNGNFVLRIDKDRLTDKTVDGFKTLLASSPIHLFYQLKTPQMINLTEYPNRIELNTYRDEIFTFFKGMNPTKFTLSVPMDKTYRYEIAEEGQGLANRVTVNNETISAENMVAVKEVRGQGIANIIENVDNVVITPMPNHEGRTPSHTLNNTKPATIRVHGFEPSGDTAIGTYNVTDKAYQLKVMSSNGDNSLSDYYVLNVPYKLETYADGTKDIVYHDETYNQWMFKGSSVKEYTVASDGTLNKTIEVFRGLAPRSGLLVEFKLMFTSGTTSARMYYSLNGTTYSYTGLRGMSDGNYLYVGIFNTGGTKIDIAYKTDPNAEYTNFSPLSTQVPECFMVNQITYCTSCEVTLDKQYIYSEMNSPIELDTYEGSTKVFMDGNATDTNIIIRNEGVSKIVNTYTDTEYTVYWKYVDGLGNLRVTLGGTTVEVDGKQEYATLKTQLNAPQELLYVGGYNLSIKDLMVVKGAKIDDLPYFEGSRQVGTLVLDEEGNKSYKITLVQGGSVLEQRDEDAIAFKDDNKHNVVVHKIVGVCPTKVD